MKMMRFLVLIPLLALQASAYDWHQETKLFWAERCDWSGNDLSNVRSTGQDCGGKCVSTSGCTHFTWTGYQGGTCWLKKNAVSQSQAITPNEYSVCGYLKASAPPPPPPPPPATGGSTVPDDTCLNAICQVESNCKPLPCAIDTDGTGQLSCGYFQIKSDYYQDCSTPGGGSKGQGINLPWQQCANDQACARQCIRNYITRYGAACNAKTCDTFASIHNNGPSGCSVPAKGNYLQRLHQFLG